MARIGLISNLHSHQNRRGFARIRDAAARHPEIAHVEIGRIEAVGEALRAFVREGIGVVAVNGGDGTVQATLTALIDDLPSQARPRLAILPGGMTNLIANDVGLKGRRECALSRLVAAVGGGEEGTEIVRPLISLRLAPGEVPVHGLFFGAAAFHRVILFARQKVHPIGLDRVTALAATLALVGARALFGRTEADGLFQGAPLALAIDGREDPPVKTYFLVLATTLSRLALGLSPFWGEGPGRCRYLAIESPPRRFRSALLPILRGRPRRWMTADGYASGRTDEITLRMTSPIVFDGQIFTPRADQPVTLRVEHQAVFLRC